MAVHLFFRIYNLSSSQEILQMWYFAIPNTCNSSPPIGKFPNDLSLRLRVPLFVLKLYCLGVWKQTQSKRLQRLLNHLEPLTQTPKTRGWGRGWHTQAKLITNESFCQLTHEAEFDRFKENTLGYCICRCTYFMKFNFFRRCQGELIQKHCLTSICLQVKLIFSLLQK